MQQLEHCGAMNKDSTTANALTALDVNVTKTLHL